MGELRIKMEIYGMNRLLIIATIGLIFTSFFVSASPKIRSDRKGLSDSNDISDNQRSANFVSCYESIPCGWALYTTERRQPFRRISTYTRNRLCECPSNHSCVLTDNWQDRRAYVFHCRNNDSSSHMFPFPDRK